MKQQNVTEEGEWLPLFFILPSQRRSLTAVVGRTNSFHLVWAFLRLWLAALACGFPPRWYRGPYARFAFSSALLPVFFSFIVNCMYVRTYAMDLCRWIDLQDRKTAEIKTCLPKITKVSFGKGIEHAAILQPTYSMACYKNCIYSRNFPQLTNPHDG